MSDAAVTSLVAAAIALLGWAVTFGSMRAQIGALRQDLDLVDRELAKLWTKLEGMNGHRMDSVEHEIERLRNWRHQVENDRLGRYLQDRST